jgi:hypothetical protein
MLSTAVHMRDNTTKRRRIDRNSVFYQIQLGRYCCADGQFVDMYVSEIVFCVWSNNNSGTIRCVHVFIEIATGGLLSKLKNMSQHGSKTAQVSSDYISFSDGFVFVFVGKS